MLFTGFLVAYNIVHEFVGIGMLLLFYDVITFVAGCSAVFTRGNGNHGAVTLLHVGSSSMSTCFHLVIVITAARPSISAMNISCCCCWMLFMTWTRQLLATDCRLWPDFVSLSSRDARLKGATAWRDCRTHGWQSFPRLRLLSRNVINWRVLLLDDTYGAATIENYTLRSKNVNVPWEESRWRLPPLFRAVSKKRLPVQAKIKGLLYFELHFR